MSYFDHNATAPLHPAARAAWLEVVDTLWGNPSSASQCGAAAHRRLEDCRRRWAEAFAVEPARIVFMGGATEGLNAAFVHLFETLSPDAPVGVSAVEHSAVRAAAERWFPRMWKTIAVDGCGRVRLDRLEKLIQAEKPGAVAVMAANNETGVLEPIEEVATICRRSGVRLLCDATQWVGKLPLGRLPPVDFLVFGAHKFGGPRGVSGLVLGADVAGFRGRVGGGQEAGRQSGTEDLAGIAAMTAAFQAQPAKGWSPEGRDAFVAGLEGSVFRALFLEADRLPNTVSLLPPRHRASRWIARLERKGFLVSSGSACSSGGGPSAILRATGLARTEAERVLRISSGAETPVSDWRALREALDVVLAELDDDAGEDRLTTVIEI